METKTTEQILKDCKAKHYIIADNVRWVKVEDVKRFLSERGSDMNRDIELVSRVIEKLFNDELSQSRDDEVKK